MDPGQHSLGRDANQKHSVLYAAVLYITLCHRKDGLTIYHDAFSSFLDDIRHATCTRTTAKIVEVDDSFKSYTAGGKQEASRAHQW